MKRNLLVRPLLLVIVLIGWCIPANAQTDVTSTYLQNVGFDAAPITFTVVGGTTANAEAVRIGTTGYVYTIPNWTNASVVGNNAVQIASGEYGSVANSNGFNGVTPPATDKAGLSAGACLHMSAGWGDDAIITQSVTLPEGRYALKLDAYNAHTTTGCAVNFCGFVPTSGTAVYSTLNTFPNATWVSDSIYFNLVQETTGVISIGFTTSTGSSGNGAKLFVDNVRLEYYGILVDKTNLQALVDSATTIYTAGVGNGLSDLNIAITAAQAVMDDVDATALQVANAETAMQEAITAYYWANASALNPIDITNAILNPSFETTTGGTGTGTVPASWTLDAVVSGNDIKTNGTAASDGLVNFNIWSGGLTSINLHQNITLPMGKYVLSADMRTENGKITDQHVYVEVGNISYSSDTLIAPLDYCNCTWNTLEAWQTMTDTFYVAHDGTEVIIGALGNGIGSTSAGWFQIDNFQLRYLGTDITPLVDISKNALTARAAEIEAMDFGNVGELVFNKPTTAKTTLDVAVLTAKNYVGSTLADYETALATLNEAVDAYNAVPLNAPQAATAYNLVLDNNGGWSYDGKAITWLANARTDAGLYNLQYLLEPNANYAQSFHFVAAPDSVGVDCYKLMFIDADGAERYICTGVSYGGNATQIRTTTTATNALTVRIEYAGTADYYKLYNMEASIYVGSQDAGVFAVNSHNNFRFVQAAKAEVQIAITDNYATAVLPFAASVPIGVKAYTCAATDSVWLTLSQVDALQANTPYILIGANGTYTLTGEGTATQNVYTAGLISGTLVNDSISTGFVLAANGQFNAVTEKIAVDAYHCYLNIAAAQYTSYKISEDILAAIPVLLYSTGFESAEGFATATTYNNTTVINSGNAPQQWGTYYGTPSSTSPIDGAASMQMRWYTSATENLGYTTMNFDVSKVTDVYFMAKSTNGLNVKVQYSTDGGTTFVGDSVYTLTTAAAQYVYPISAEGLDNVQLRFNLVLPETVPTATSRLIIDNVMLFGYSVPVVVVAPEFSQTAGMYYESFKVGITTETEGASILYTTNGDNPALLGTAYTDSITITETTTLKAVAIFANDTSDVTEATYIMPVEVADIAAFVAAAGDDLYRITGTLTVTYQNDRYLYVKDASGALVIYGTQTETYTNGQTLTGVCGAYSLYHGLHELVPTRMPEAQAGESVAPAAMALNAVTAAAQSQYVYLENVSFTEDATYTLGTRGTSVAFTNGVDTIAFYNSFALLDGSYLSTDKYNVIAVVSVYDNVQLLPISTELVPSSGLQTTTLTDGLVFDGNTLYNPLQVSMVLYNAAGQLIATSHTDMNMTAMPAGIYIVRTQNTVMKIVK